MPEAVAQSYKNHRKFVPLFHFVTVPLLLLNLGWALYRLFSGLPGVPLADRLIAVLTAAALGLVAFFARDFALTVQNRLIRLEMQVRLERLLPADLKPRIGELSPGQLIGLRFADDEELPGLTRRVLDERITRREEIKKLVTRWRPDHLRV